TDPIRRHALSLVVDYPENVDGLATDCQIAVGVPGRSTKEYERALREAETICRLQDSSPEHWALLGMAQYRVAQFAQALKTFEDHSQLDSPHAYLQVRQLAFMAMAQHGLGRTEEARQTLARAHEIMKQPFVNGRTLVENFLREADDVLRSVSAHH